MSMNNNKKQEYQKIIREEMKEYDPILKTLPQILTQKEDFSNFFTQFEPEKIIFPDDVLPFYNFDLPECLKWDTGDVADWLRDVVNLPQYTNTFFVNQIDGKKLLYLLPNHLPDINIQDFDHIKRLNKFIKELFDVECEGFDHGDISLLAPKVVRYQYLLTKTRIGYEYKILTPKDFMIKILMAIPGQELVECSWDNIDPAKRSYNILLKAARTGAKRIPGEKRDLSHSVTWVEVNKKNLYLNENYPFQLKIIPKSH